MSRHPIRPSIDAYEATEPFTTHEDSDTMHDATATIADHTPKANGSTPKLPDSIRPTATGTMVELVASLSAQLPGRAEAIRCLALAFLAREHCLLVGPPGTAKSMLVRLFTGAFGLTYWETLVTRYSTPEDLFGPIDVAKIPLGEYRRITMGFLPCAEVGFLDEVFKGNSAILNALLGIMNERVYHDGGRVTITPVRSIVGASNELPDPDDGLDAIADRFLVRCETGYVGASDFVAMLRYTGACDLPSVDLDIACGAVASVTIGSDIETTMGTLREALRAEGVIASDRRWRQSLMILRANAYLDSRTDVEPEDLAVLAHVLSPPAKRAVVDRVIGKLVAPDATKANDRVKAARELLKSVVSGSTEELAGLKRIAPEIKAIVAEIKALPEGRATTRAQNDMAAIVAEIRERATAAAARTAEVM